VKDFAVPSGMTRKTVHYGRITTTDWYIDGLPENNAPWFL